MIPPEAMPRVAMRLGATPPEEIPADPLEEPLVVTQRAAPQLAEMPLAETAPAVTLVAAAMPLEAME